MQGGFLQSRTLEEFTFSRLFLASIVRMFLCLQVWLKLRKKKTTLVYVLFACVFH